MESTESFLNQKTPIVISYQQLYTRKLLKIHQFGFGMKIPFWPQEQAKLLSIINAKFTLITLNKSLLYGAAPCITQELECEITNIFFISINFFQAVFERYYTRCRIRNRCFPKLFLCYSIASCTAPLLKILEKYF